jgi:hypothetical protein
VLERPDVFVRVFAISDGSLRGDLRWGLTQAVIARWLMQKDINLTLLCAGAIIRIAGAESVLLSEEKFHMESKRVAEKRSHTPIYVIADDDCLPIGKDFIARGLQAMEIERAYGILGATSISDGHYPAGKPFGSAYRGDDILRQPGMYGDEFVDPMYTPGGIVFTRKGILRAEALPDCEANQVDDTIAREIEKFGFRVGVLHSVKFNHLGAHFSLTGGAGNWLA